MTTTYLAQLTMSSISRAPDVPDLEPCGILLKATTVKTDEARCDSTDVDERVGHYNRFQYDTSEDEEDDDTDGGVSLYEYHAP